MGAPALPQRADRNIRSSAAPALRPHGAALRRPRSCSLNRGRRALDTGLDQGQDVVEQDHLVEFPFFLGAQRAGRVPVEQGADALMGGWREVKGRDSRAVDAGVQNALQSQATLARLAVTYGVIRVRPVDPIDRDRDTGSSACTRSIVPKRRETPRNARSQPS